MQSDVDGGWRVQLVCSAELSLCRGCRCAALLVLEVTASGSRRQVSCHCWWQTAVAKANTELAHAFC